MFFIYINFMIYLNFINDAFQDLLKKRRHTDFGLLMMIEIIISRKKLKNWSSRTMLRHSRGQKYTRMFHTNTRCMIHDQKNCSISALISNKNLKNFEVLRITFSNNLNVKLPTIWTSGQKSSLSGSNICFWPSCSHATSSTPQLRSSLHFTDSPYFMSGRIRESMFCLTTCQGSKV